MSFPQLDLLAAVLELFERVLANRLEHREALAVPAHQAVVDESGNVVEPSVADGFG